ncbi:serine/threonine-protein kinase [Streptomyces sp. PT12]|uniref:serine/threonine-protein kinase n=1 Tax=Streptomyces sp. PT12 TaxID=1510197 RepID=UPI000DE266BE|nr:serine/threonine-protein kinase [Streptomyces sp. PT12]RBM14126.1 hypothetical protein DEH69_18880 [Streptomyces sp. PT12]
MVDGESGQVLDGRFELVERLGSGGMGTVWRARDLALQREVAVKQVHPLAPELAPDPTLRERVLREARALARLNHPHVVTIHHIIDVGEGFYPWLVMELVTGGSLAKVLDNEGSLEPREAARIGRQVLAALRAAHDAGILHRDVKPANVLLRPNGEAVLTDFGIAALQRTDAVDPAARTAPLTATGEFIGTPDYLAPERIRGVDDSPASDLWSLGMMLYVCVEGHNPMRRPTALATVAAVIDGTVPPPVQAGTLTPVLKALLVPDPAARPAAERLDVMLANAEASTVPTARFPAAGGRPPTMRATIRVPEREPHTPSTVRPSRRRKRSWLTAGATVAATVLVVATTYVLTSRGGGTEADGDTGEDTSTGSQNELGLYQPGTLTVAMYADPAAAGDVPGLTPGEDGGLQPDLAYALGEQLGLQVEIVDADTPSEMVAGLLSRPRGDRPQRFDVAMPVQDVAYFDRSDRAHVDLIHYFDYGYAVYTWREASQDIQSWADLCGMEIDVDDEYAAAVEERSYEVCGSRPIEVRTGPLGDVDAVITGLPWAVNSARDSEGEIHLSDGDLTEDLPMAMFVGDANPDLRDALLEALGALIDSGEYGDILADWGLEDGAVTTAQLISGS